MSEGRHHAPRGPIKSRDPMAPTDPMAPQWCTARSKTSGNQCRHRAIPGGTVCRFHGGAAPQVKAAAERRLADLIPKAVEYYDWLLTQRQFPSAGLGAANAVWDREKGKPTERVEQQVDANITFQWQS